MNRLLTILEVLLIVLLFICAMFLISTRKPNIVFESRILTFEQSITSELNLEIQEIRSVPYSFSNRIDVGGWIPDWDMVDGLESVKVQNNLDYISPVWFKLTEEEKLVPNNYANGPGIMKEVQNKSIALIPTILQLNPLYLSNQLETDLSIQNHIKDILYWIDEYNYDGVDLDYEVIFLKDKKKFYKFLETLSKELHSRNKILAMSLLPIWSDNTGSTASPQTRRVQEYSEIHKYLDELRLMTYELSYSGSQIAGPVAPIDWLEATVQFAIKSGVPRNKIILGIPTYAYDWSERGIAQNEVDFYNLNTTNIIIREPLENGVPLYNESVNDIKSKYDYTDNYNDYWQESVLKYTFRDLNRIVVYPSQKSLDARKDLAQKYGIKGVAYWRIGDEDGLIF